MAVALEQEMRAAVVEAEAEIPKAMAEALRSGNISVMDYYKLKNVQADTEMKKGIGEGAQRLCRTVKKSSSSGRIVPATGTEKCLPVLKQT